VAAATGAPGADVAGGGASGATTTTTTTPPTAAAAAAAATTTTSAAAGVVAPGGATLDSYSAGKPATAGAPSALRALVLDLRDNPGGLLEAGVAPLTLTLAVALTLKA
jgi:hypothetical protein